MFDWSGNSPDLNLIEKLAAILKDKVADENPTNAKNLKMKIKRIWTQKIIAEYCKHLVHSKLLLRKKVDIPNNRFLHENWRMLHTFQLISLLFNIYSYF